MKDYKPRVFHTIYMNLREYCYCNSHHFVFNEHDEERKLYDAKPCVYTDIRFKYNSNSSRLYLYNSKKPISIRNAFRLIRKCKGLPIDNIELHNWNTKYYYRYKVKKVKPLDVVYEINNPLYEKHFTNCDFSNKLTKALRDNGFIVEVYENSSFLLDLVNYATIVTGGNNTIDSRIEGECAIAYGYGKKIGFSSFNDKLFGYSNGMDNILYDIFGSFDKWSRCEEIPKTTSIEEIVKILKEGV